MSAGFSRPHVSHIAYRSGQLCVENVSVSAIATEYVTPFYVYSVTSIQDLVALGMAGANCSTMSSNCNPHPLVQKVLVAGERYCLVRRWQTAAAMLELEQMDEWRAA